MKSWAKDGSQYSGMMLEEIANKGPRAMQGRSMTKRFAKTCMETEPTDTMPYSHSSSACP
jgi:hypothetical protein